MIFLRPHHRVHVPNSLAIFAGLLLLISGIASFEAKQEEVSSGQQATISEKVDTAGSEGVGNAVKIKSGGLKLGLLFFSRG